MSRWARLRTPTLTVAVLALLTLALRVHDPHRPWSWGICPTALLLDLDCPACGSLRAVNDLTHLRPGAAASSNLLLVAAIPVAVGALALWLVDGYRGRPRRRLPARLRRPVAYALIGVAVAFTVARNLPGSWLAA